MRELVILTTGDIQRALEQKEQVERTVEASDRMNMERRSTQTIKRGKTQQRG